MMTMIMALRLSVGLVRRSMAMYEFTLLVYIVQKYNPPTPKSTVPAKEANAIM